MEPTVITVKGEGGAIFDMDVPAPGTVQRELLDDALAKGRLKLLDGEYPPAEEIAEPSGDEAEAPKPRRSRTKIAEPSGDEAEGGEG